MSRIPNTGTGKPVFRIRNMLVRIRFLGSVHLIYGSILGSVHLIYGSTFRCRQETSFFFLLVLLLLALGTLHFHQSFKIITDPGPKTCLWIRIWNTAGNITGHFKLLQMLRCLGRIIIFFGGGGGWKSITVLSTNTHLPLC